MSEELRERLSVVQKRWSAAGTSTEPIDHAVAEEGLRLAYGCVGLAAPTRILWVPSPWAGVQLLRSVDAVTPSGNGASAPENWLNLFRGLGDIRRGAVTRARAAGLGEDALNVAFYVVVDQIEEQLVFGTADRISEAIVRELDKHPAPADLSPSSPAVLSLPSAADLSLPSPADLSLPSPADFPRPSPLDTAYTGYFTQYECAITESLRVLGVDVPPGWEGLTALGLSAHWFWAFDDEAVMCERPVLMRCDADGLLVDESTAVIRYSDGWSF